MKLFFFFFGVFEIVTHFALGNKKNLFRLFTFPRFEFPLIFRFYFSVFLFLLQTSASVEGWTNTECVSASAVRLWMRAPERVNRDCFRIDFWNIFWCQRAKWESVDCVYTWIFRKQMRTHPDERAEKKRVRERAHFDVCVSDSSAARFSQLYGRTFALTVSEKRAISRGHMFGASERACALRISIHILLPSVHILLCYIWFHFIFSIRHMIRIAVWCIRVFTDAKCQQNTNEPNVVNSLGFSYISGAPWWFVLSQPPRLRHYPMLRSRVLFISLNFNVRQ